MKVLSSWTRNIHLITITWRRKCVSVLVLVPSLWGGVRPLCSASSEGRLMKRNQVIKQDGPRSFVLLCFTYAHSCVRSRVSRNSQTYCEHPDFKSKDDSIQSRLNLSVEFVQVTCPAAASWMTTRSSPALETPPGEWGNCAFSCLALIAFRFLPFRWTATQSYVDKDTQMTINYCQTNFGWEWLWEQLGPIPIL